MSGYPPSYPPPQQNPNAPPPPAYGFNTQPPAYAQAVDYGQPGAYGQPQPGAYGQPQPGAYGQPQPGAYGQPQPGAYGQPQPGAYGEPQGYGKHNAWGNPAPNAAAIPMANHDPEAAASRSSTAPKYSDDHAMFTGSFSDKSIRRAFVRKVYLILFTQLAITFGTICLFIFCKPVKNFVQDNFWVYMVAYALFLVLYIAIVCCKNVRRKSPGNFICLGAFTFSFSYLVGTISSFHDTSIVLMAAGITAGLCLAISIFAMQTKIDFTMCSGFLFVLCITVLLFGIAAGITASTWGGGKVLNCVYGGLLALLFGLFLIYDTQKVMGGRDFELSPEDYITGALELYVDVVYIFIIILGFSGSNN